MTNESHNDAMPPLEVEQYNFFTRLPTELVEEVLAYINDRDLSNFGQVSKNAYKTSMPLLWKSLSLSDKQIPGHAPGEHDDSDMIAILVTLASNHWLASLVQHLQYRCHLPPHVQKNDVQGLSRECSVQRSLSADIRTIHLVKLAMANLTNLKNLRITHGHHYLVQAIIGQLFRADSRRSTSMRALVLEECSTSFDPSHFSDRLDFSGLRHLDITGISLGNADSEPRWKVMVKQGQQAKYNDKHSKTYECRLQDVQGELGEYSKILEWRGTRNEKRSLELVDDDEVSYMSLPQDRPESMPLLPAEMSKPLPRLQQLLSFAVDKPYKEISIADFWWVHNIFECLERSILLPIFRSSASTLTSITLDWEGVIMDRSSHGNNPVAKSILIKLLSELFSLTFPNLTALHNRPAPMRSGVELPDMFIFPSTTTTPTSSDLLTIISQFFTRHPNLTSLKWPADQFFPPCPLPHSPLSTTLLTTLSSLKSLQISTCLLRPVTPSDQSSLLTRLQNFTTLLCPTFTSLTSLSISGTLPASLVREILRALRLCPLASISLVSPIWPGGFVSAWDDPALVPAPTDGSESWIESWRRLGDGILVRDEPDEDVLALETVRRINAEGVGDEVENKARVYRYGEESPHEAVLGVMARYFRSTITRIALEGYVGCPVLGSPGVCGVFLEPLRHCTGLREVRCTVLPALEARDGRPTVKHWWKSKMRDVDMWEQERKIGVERTEHPWRKLGREVAETLGPYLSEEAKGRPGGVRVHALFFTDGMDVALDVDTGMEGGLDVMLGYEGPYDEPDELGVNRFIKSERYSSSAGSWDQHAWMTTFQGIGFES